MKRILRAIAVATLGFAAILLAGSAPSLAASYTLNFTGKVTSVGGTFGPDVAVGDALSGSVTFDPFNSTTSTSIGGGTARQFDQASASFSLSVPTYAASPVVTAAGLGAVQVNANAAPPSGLQFLVQSANVTFGVGLLTSGNTVLTSLDALPTDFAGLQALFGGTPFFAGGSLDIKDVGSLGFSVDTSATTPLPAALPLFLAALGGLGMLGRRRARSAA
jgi:hypothetical protein